MPRRWAYLISAPPSCCWAVGLFRARHPADPAGVAAGLLAGILLQFGIKAFGGMSVDPLLAGLLIVAYVVLKRFGTLCRRRHPGAGAGFLLSQRRVDLSGLELRSRPVFTSRRSRSMPCSASRCRCSSSR
jgi:benzoate membrane transport protein